MSPERASDWLTAMRRFLDRSVRRLTERDPRLDGTTTSEITGAGAQSEADPLSGPSFEVARSEDQWQQLLTPAQYAVLRASATERPFTSVLLREHRLGTFLCAGCQLDLFSSTTKFESRTGWPSFWAPLEKAVETTRDTSLGMERTAVHCRRCGGHL